MQLTNIERRVLAYIDQRGGKAERQTIVCDLADPESRVGMGYVNGSGGHLAMIFGRWSKRLSQHGLIEAAHRSDGFYLHHAITPVGRNALRSNAGEG